MREYRDHEAEGADDRFADGASEGDPMEPDYEALASEEVTSLYQDSRDAAGLATSHSIRRFHASDARRKPVEDDIDDPVGSGRGSRGGPSRYSLRESFRKGYEERMMLQDVMDELRKPFDPEQVSWKPQAISRDKSRALALAYADARAYQDRLNEVVGDDWSDDYEVLNGGGVVLCHLTVGGVTRSDIGEADPHEANTATSALAQAFKRAAVKFGVGRYLYDLPKMWVDWDPERRRFTQRAERDLRAALEGRQLELQMEMKMEAQDNGDERKENTGQKVGPTDFWRLYHERGRGVVAMETAEAWAKTSDWSTALRKLQQALN
jgi:hypothetical protein